MAPPTAVHLPTAAVRSRPWPRSPRHKNYPVGIAVSAGGVYWAAAGSSGAQFNDGTIMSAPLGGVADGGAAVTLATAQRFPYAIAVERHDPVLDVQRQRGERRRRHECSSRRRRARAARDRAELPYGARR